MPPVFDLNRCNGCGACIFQCGARALGFDVEIEKARLRKPRACVDCFICEGYCSKRAISIKMIRRGEKK